MAAAPEAGPISDADSLPTKSNQIMAWGPDLPLAYSLTRLANALSLSKATIKKLISRSELHPFALGDVLIVANEVDAWLDKKLAEVIERLPAASRSSIDVTANFSHQLCSLDPIWTQNQKATIRRQRHF